MDYYSINSIINLLNLKETNFLGIISQILASKILLFIEHGLKTTKDNLSNIIYKIQLYMTENIST